MRLKKNNHNYFSIISFKFIKANKTKIVLLFVSLIFSLFSILITIGAYLGFNNLNKEFPFNYLNYNKFEISSVIRTSTDNSSIEIAKKERPNIDEIKLYLSNFSDIYVDYNLNYFIQGKKEIKFSTQKFENVAVEFYYSKNCEDEIIVNSLFEDLFYNKNDETSLYKTLNIKFEKDYVYKSFIKEEYVEVKDVFEINKKYKIEKIFQESTYLNNPKIYLPYQDFKNYLLIKKPSEINRIFIQNYSWFDLLKMSNDDDEIGMYNLNFWLDSKQEINEIFNIINDNNKNKPIYEINSLSFSTAQSFKGISNIISLGLIFFSLITVITTIGLLIFIVISIYLKEIKDISILKILGYSNKDISYILIYIITFIFIVSLAISSLLSLFFKAIINYFSLKLFPSSGILISVLNNHSKYFLLIALIMLGIYLLIILIQKYALKTIKENNISIILREE